MRTWLYHPIHGAKIFDEPELAGKGWEDSPHEFNRKDADTPRRSAVEAVPGLSGKDDNRSGPEPDGQGNKPGRSSAISDKRSVRRSRIPT